MSTPASPPPPPPARFDPVRGTVRATIEIAAPPERVFDALTDPEQLAEWWGSAEYETHSWSVDARPGGGWSVRTTDATGAEGSVRGEYRAVDPPRVLEYTWAASWDDFAPTTVRFDLVPALVGGVSGTRLTVTHGGFTGALGLSTAGAVCCAVPLGGVLPNDAWARVLGRLAHHATLLGWPPALRLAA